METTTRKSWKVVRFETPYGEAFRIADSHGNWKLWNPPGSSDPTMWWRTREAAEFFLRENVR